jgi:choice-of-anchor B domain-containing protein
MVDFNDPSAPSFAGCAGSNGYVHDTLCVNYKGADAGFAGKEICFNAEGDDSLSIVDVTTKSAPRTLSRVTYSGGEYSHQGWLTDDHAYFVMSDELDEQRNGHRTRAYVFDVRELEAPTLVGVYSSESTAIDHNLVIDGNYAYQANYTSGLRILDLSDIATAALREVAFFDITPGSDAARLSGAWDAYPLFGDGTVLVNDTQAGFFVLRTDPTLVVPEQSD